MSVLHRVGWIVLLIVYLLDCSKPTKTFNISIWLVDH
jgi:hypothetical protein